MLQVGKKLSRTCLNPLLSDLLHQPRAFLKQEPTAYETDALTTVPSPVTVSL